MRGFSMDYIEYQQMDNDIFILIALLIAKIVVIELWKLKSVFVVSLGHFFERCQQVIA